MPAEFLDSIHPPDTWRSHVIAVVACLLQFICLGFLNAFGVFIPQLQREFGLTNRATLSMIASTANLITPFVGICVGKYIDNHNFRPVIAVALFSFFAMHFASSFAQNTLAMVCSYGIFGGIAAGCAITPSVSAVVQWYEKYRSLAIGVAYVGSGSGSAIIPPIAEYLLRQYDWRVVFRMFSGVALLLIFPLLVLRKRVKHPHHHVHHNQHQVQMESGEKEYTETSPLLDIHAPSLLVVVSEYGESIQPTKPSIAAAVKNRAFVPLFAIGVLYSYGFFIPMIYIVVFARMSGIPPSSAVYILSVFNFSITVGNIVFGVLADVFNTRPLFLICHFVSGVALCALPLHTTLAGFWVFAVVAGLFNGGCITCYPALASKCFPPHLISTAVSTVYTGFGIGSYLGPTVTGIILDRTGSFAIPLEIGGTAFFAALIIGLFITESHL